MQCDTWQTIALHLQYVWNTFTLHVHCVCTVLRYATLDVDAINFVFTCTLFLLYILIKPNTSIHNIWTTYDILLCSAEKMSWTTQVGMGNVLALNIVKLGEGLLLYHQHWCFFEFSTVYFWIYICIYIYISIHLSIHLSIYLSISLSIYLSIYLSI